MTDCTEMDSGSPVSPTSVMSTADPPSPSRKRARPTAITALPSELLHAIFSHMDAATLSASVEVCRTWASAASTRSLWASLRCTPFRAMASDPSVARMLRCLAHNDQPGVWHSRTFARWSFQMFKANRYCCRLSATMLYNGGQSAADVALPGAVVIDRRFPLAGLVEFTLPDAAIFYFEPERESDEKAYCAFVDYLTSRDRAGLALNGRQRIVFVPPCAYAWGTLGYCGKRMVGIVQNTFPEVAFA